jgi:hypothetical protein
MASDQTELKYARQLVQLYKDLYVERYGKAPLFNSHRDLWGFRRMFSDLGYDVAREVVESYFAFRDKYNHNYSELFNNYDRYAVDIEESAALAKKDEENRIETERRVKEWRAKNGERTGTTA